MAAPRRRMSIDGVRGWSIFIMLIAVQPFPREHLPAQLKHLEWHGLTFADTFFPVFLFAMGAAMTMSRRAGSPRAVLRRVALLFGLGVLLSSMRHRELALPGVLQHIAVAYLLAWVVLQAPRRAQPVIAAGIVAAVWAAHVLWVPDGADPWSRDETFTHAANRVVYGRFATEGIVQTFTSTVNVLGGAFVGRWMLASRDDRKLSRGLWIHAGWLVALGLVMALSVPINKRIWSPSYTVLTLGIACGWTALFVWAADIRRPGRWIEPLRWLGSNPIAIYAVFMAATAVIARRRHDFPDLAPFGSETAGALLYGALWLALGLVFARELFRRRIFVKI